jgi:hypothetical protein
MSLKARIDSHIDAVPKLLEYLTSLERTTSVDFKKVTVNERRITFLELRKCENYFIENTSHECSCDRTLRLV